LFLCSPLSLLNWRYCFSHGIAAALLLHYHEILSKTAVAFLPENFRKADTKVLQIIIPAKYFCVSIPFHLPKILCVSRIFFRQRRRQR